MSASGSSSGGQAPRGRGRGARGTAKQTPGGMSSLANGGSGATVRTNGASSVSSLALSMQKLDVQYEVMKRPDYGAKGREIALIANYVQLRLGSNGGAVALIVQRYDCTIDTERRPVKDRDEMREIFWQFVDKNPKLFPKKFQLTYDDSKTVYSTEKLSLQNGEQTFNVVLELERDFRPTTYRVKLQYTGSHQVDMRFAAAPDPAERTFTPMQVIDLVSSQSIRCPLLPEKFNGWYPWKRAVFMRPKGPPLSLGGGVDLWTGLHMAGKVGGSNWKPLLNLDVAHTPFYKRQPLVDFMCEILDAKFRRNPRAPPMFTVDMMNAETALNRDHIAELSRALKGLKLRTTHSPQCVRVYKFTQLGQGTAASTSFVTKAPDGTEQERTVADYILERYNVKLKFPHLPVVQVGPKQKQIMLPMELLELNSSPQKFTRKLSDKQTADMIRASAKPPQERRQNLEQLIAAAGIGGAQDPFMKEFGISLDTKLLPVKARVLQAPALKIGQQQPLEVREGKWRYNPGAKFERPAQNICYSLISFLPKQEQAMLQSFCERQVQECTKLGMSFAENWPKHVKYVRFWNDLESAFKEMGSAKAANGSTLEPNLIFVAMDRRDAQCYAEVKRLGDVELGVVSQVLLRKQLETVARGGGATAVNIAYKINMKMGGINNAIHAQAADKIWQKLTGDAQKTTLFLGMDVTHPGPLEKNQPSIASVVGNVNASATSWGASIKVQRQRREHIIYPVDVMKERLVDYYRKTGLKPTQIIVYRDGVSEGEFMKVLREEMGGIRSACLSLDSAYTPSITYIIVQKRHHTRFFPQNAREGCGRAGNVPPGTTVDRDITHPSDFDFFLCSHFGALGTSRPTHYYVLHDDKGFGADELQQLTYQLCHIYGRCAQTVSIPAPVYFAHLCAARAAVHARAFIGSDSGSRSIADRSAPSGASATTASSDADLQRACLPSNRVTKKEMDRQEMEQNQDSSGGQAPRGRGRGARGTAKQTPGGMSSLANGGTGATARTNGASSVSSLALSMQKLDVQYEVMQRPDYGAKGREIALIANYVQLRLGSNGGAVALIVQRYDCTIDTERRPVKDRDEMREIFWQFVDKNPALFPRKFQLTYDDSKTVYSTEKLSLQNGEQTFNVVLELERDFRPTTYRVKLQYTGSHQVDMRFAAAPDPAERTFTPMQVIDLVSSQSIRCPLLPEKFNSWYPWKRAVFRRPEGPPVSLGGGVDLWKGLHMAGKVGGSNWKPLLNLDVAHTPFYKRQPLVDFMCEILDAKFRRNPRAPPMFTVAMMNANTRLDGEQMAELSRALKGLKLRTTHLPQSVRVYKFTQLGQGTATNTSFVTRAPDGTELERTVANYLLERYNVNLDYPHLPVVQVGPRQKQMMLPMELLELNSSPQKFTRKLSDKQTADMIRASAKPPQERRQNLERLIAAAGIGGAQDPFMKEFGISLDTKLLPVKARVLQAPALKIGQQQPLEVREGKWRYNPGAKFERPAQNICYSLISFLPQREQAMLESFCERQVQECTKLGISFAENWPVHVKYVRFSSEVEAAFKEITSDKQTNGSTLAPNLVFVAMDRRDAQCYAEVKRMGDVELGVVSQVLLRKQLETVARGGGATAVNIAYKINMKMGGINNAIHAQAADKIWQKLTGDSQKTTLFLGMDVTHPGPLEKNQPSIASVVGNVNASATSWGASIKVQRQRREHIIYPVDVMKERLVDYYRKTGLKPTQIIVYRDGVSEGEFMKVLRSLDSAYTPSITYIIVQKRHHTRFFPQNAREGCGRAGNVPPGTTVDRDITHPSDFDFFLCSHFGALGTSRPTHYYVLHDDKGFGADELQQLTYQLCHIYGRCAQTVSIPAPVYFAHLCAARAAVHARAFIGSDSGSRSIADRNAPSGASATTASSDADLQRACLPSNRVTKKEMDRQEMEHNQEFVQAYFI